MLPEGWRRLQVSDVCSMLNGRGFGPEDWSKQGLPIIRIQNLNGGAKFDYYDGVVESRWLVEPGQLLFAWAGTKGVSFGPTIWRGETGVLNQHIFKVLAKPGIDPSWLLVALRQVTDRIEAAAHGFKATLVHVKKSEIDRQEVWLPPLPEQQRIAASIGTWDDAITATERLLANSRRQKETLAQSMLRGEFRRAGYSASRVMVASRVGRVPQEWARVSIGSIAAEVKEKSAGNEGLPVLSCTKRDGLVDSLSYFKKRVFSEDTSAYKVVPSGCFVYATNHIDEGSIGYQDLYPRALVSPMYTVFKTDDRVDDGFLYKVLKTEHYRQVFAANTSASVDRRGGLRWSDFRKIEVALPSLAEQRAIAQVIDAAHAEMTQIRAMADELRAEKRALMADLLTGKRRIRLPAAQTTP